jgi:hypothetical protein
MIETEIRNLINYKNEINLYNDDINVALILQNKMPKYYRSEEWNIK